jgi:hypothetical protein
MFQESQRHEQEANAFFAQFLQTTSSLPPDSRERLLQEKINELQDASSQYRSEISAKV